MHGLTAPDLEAIEAAARHAAVSRSDSRSSEPLPPDPSILTAESESEGVAAVLRHRLRLDADTRLSVYSDAIHPLFPGAQLFRASRIQLSRGRRSYFFIATYEAWAAHLTFSLIAPCHVCCSPVPTAVVNDLADFGDWLLNGRDGVKEAPQFRTSPVHRRACSVATR